VQKQLGKSGEGAGSRIGEPRGPKKWEGLDPSGPIGVYAYAHVCMPALLKLDIKQAKH